MVYSIYYIVYSIVCSGDRLARPREPDCQGAQRSQKAALDARYNIMCYNMMYHDMI